MRNSILRFALLGVACALCARAELREVLVVEAGKKTTAILLAAEPTSSAQYAALEVQHHLEKITDEKVPIVREPSAPSASVKIAVGATALAKSLGFPVDGLDPWEFLVAEKDGVIVLAGGDDQGTEEVTWDRLGPVPSGKPIGTCRAAFEFLEEYCGVHWYLPSAAGMVFPRTPRLVVRMGDPVRRRTDFLSTSFYPMQVNGNMFCAPYTPELKGDNVPDSDLEKWRRKFWHVPVTTKDMLPVREVSRWLLRNKVGGERYGPNHSFGKWIMRFGRERPDWFSYKSADKIEAVLAEGEKKAFYKFHSDGEPCLTAPGVFEQVVSDARDYFDRRRGKGDPARKDVRYEGSQGRFFGIVPNDNYVWCKCASCKAQYGTPAVDCPLWGGATGKASSYVWDFANRVARDVRKTHPEAWVAGIGYHDYMAPPQDFVLAPNVAVTICTYLGNWTPALRETAYGLIRAWRDQAKCQWIGLWEYFCYCAMSQWQPMVPKVCPRLMAADVKTLHGLGVRAEFIESEDTYWFKDAPDRGWAVWANPIWLYLNVWTRFKLWDDTTRDIDRLLADHYRLFYGPAAGPVQRFFDRIEGRVTDMSLRGPKTFNDRSVNRVMADFEYLFPPEIMKELRGCVDEATTLATEAPFKTRVGWVREGFLEPQEEALARYLAEKKKTAANQPRRGVCYRLKHAPAIDGAATDEAWAGLPFCFLGDWRTAAKPKAATWFRMGWHEGMLYFAIRCQDPAVGKIRAACRDRDGDVFRDDCVELHLTCDPERSRRVQIVVNTLGVVQDFLHTLNEAGATLGDLSWNCPGLATAAKVDGEGYTIEVGVPFSALEGTAGPGRFFYANVCREKYSASDNGRPEELQTWSPTPWAFSDGRRFGSVVLAEEDAWRLFFDPNAAPPAPVLYKANPKSPWALVPDAISATVELDRARYAMKCPEVDAKGRTYGGFGVNLAQPVDVTRHPYVEVAFRKPSPDVMLELLYSYVGEAGEESRNYVIVSRFGEANKATRIFAGKLAKGAEKDRPAPRLLKKVTVFAVVSGARTPGEYDFILEWIRVCRDASSGPLP